MSKVLLIAMVLLSTCKTVTREPIKKYKGGVVYRDKEKYRGYRTFTILIADTFKDVHVHELDYKKYKVGDTIK